MILKKSALLRYYDNSNGTNIALYLIKVIIL